MDYAHSLAAEEETGERGMKVNDVTIKLSLNQESMEQTIEVGRIDEYTKKLLVIKFKAMLDILEEANNQL